MAASTNGVDPCKDFKTSIILFYSILFYSILFYSILFYYSILYSVCSILFSLEILYCLEIEIFCFLKTKKPKKEL